MNETNFKYRNDGTISEIIIISTENLDILRGLSSLPLSRTILKIDGFESQSLKIDRLHNEITTLFFENCILDSVDLSGDFQEIMFEDCKIGTTSLFEISTFNFEVQNSIFNSFQLVIAQIFNFSIKNSHIKDFSSEEVGFGRIWIEHFNSSSFWLSAQKCTSFYCLDSEISRLVFEGTVIIECMFDHALVKTLIIDGLYLYSGICSALQVNSIEIKNAFLPFHIDPKLPIPSQNVASGSSLSSTIPTSLQHHIQKSVSILDFFQQHPRDFVIWDLLIGFQRHGGRLSVLRPFFHKRNIRVIKIIDKLEEFLNLYHTPVFRMFDVSSTNFWRPSWNEAEMLKQLLNLTTPTHLVNVQQDLIAKSDFLNTLVVFLYEVKTPQEFEKILQINQIKACYQELLRSGLYSFTGKIMFNPFSLPSYQTRHSEALETLIIESPHLITYSDETIAPSTIECNPFALILNHPRDIRTKVWNLLSEKISEEYLARILIQTLNLTTNPEIIDWIQTRLDITNTYNKPN